MDSKALKIRSNPYKTVGLELGFRLFLTLLCIISHTQKLIRVVG